MQAVRLSVRPSICLGLFTVQHMTPGAGWPRRGCRWAPAEGVRVPPAPGRLEPSQPARLGMMDVM